MSQVPPLVILNGGWDQRIHIFRADEQAAGEQVDAFAVVTQASVVFIDTLATPALARQMVTAMRDFLDHRQPIVINTHADYDHCWGNAVFAAEGELPAPIYGHELAATRLTSPEDRNYLAEQQRHDPRFAEVRLVPPTMTIHERTIIDGGDLQLELIPAPGHTPDHIAVWVPTIRTLFAGDAAESPFPYVHDARALPQLLHSLERLAALEPVIVLPCHGGTTDPQLLQRNLAYFAAIKHYCQVAITRGEVPTDWRTQSNLADQIGMPYADALVLTHVDADQIPPMYRDFHEVAIRATLEELAESENIS